MSECDATSDFLFSALGLQMVFSMCPSIPQSVTSAVYNQMIGVGSLLSLGILALTSYQWDWYPRAEDGVSDHFLGNEKVAYYYWLLAGVMVVTAFCTFIVGRICDIGVHRGEAKHQRLVNEDVLQQERLPSSVETGTD